MLLLVAGLAGAGVMVLELMGVRLLAPHFGQSQIVWTNVIGVVLGALSLGQWWGGRLAEGGRTDAALLGLLLAGSVALVLPDIVPWLAELTLPARLQLGEAAPFVTWGSLLVALVGLGVPLLALGVVTPCLVRLSRGVERRPGSVTGQLLGVGTLGSLLGTFGATHALLPWLGSAGAVRCGGALLVLAGLALWTAGVRARGRALGAALLPLVALATPPVAPDPRVLAEGDTPYQYMRVMADDDGRRWLALNEGLDSFHSVWTPGELLTGEYYDAFLLPSLLAAPAGEPRRVLVIGLAAGTMARQLLALDPDARVTGVELDPELVEAGRRWFDLPPATETLVDLDGRVALERSDRRWGAILIDAFSSQIYVPAQLATREAFDALRERLLPGGWAALNLSARGIEDPVARAVAGSFARAFPGARLLRVPGTRNLFVLGRREGAVDPADPAWADALAAAGLRPTLDWLLDPTRWSGADVLPAAEPGLRDGHAPVEALAHRAWSGAWAPLPAPAAALATDVAPELRLERAASALRRTHWSAAEAWLDAEAASWTPAQRARRELLRGNVAFERGHWRAAAAAYADVLANPSAAPEVSAAARDNRAFVEAADARRAELERRARWVALAALGVLVAGAGSWQVARRRPLSRVRAARGG